MKIMRTHRMFRRITACIASLLVLNNSCIFTKTFAVQASDGTDGSKAAAIQNDDPERFRFYRTSDRAVISKEGIDNISESLTHNQRFDEENYTYRYGVDVSTFQSDIDWQKAADAGIDFAIIRIGFRGYGSAGKLMEDEKFQANIEGAKAAGLDVGVYFFTQAITEEEAVEEANFVLDTLDGAELTAPVYIDIEDITYDSGRMDNANLTRDQYTANCDAFCRTIEEAGYRAGIYANMNWLHNFLDHEYLQEKYEIWLAHYTQSTSYEGEYSSWQYSSEGSVPGIPSTYVDRDVHYSRKLDYTEDFITLSDPSTPIKPELLGQGNYGKITYEAADPSILTVKPNGALIPKKSGITEVTATSANGTSDTIQVEVKIPLKVSLNYSSMYFSEIGAQKELKVTANTDEPLTIVWESSNSNVVTVDENGVVQTVGCGVARITATAYGVDPDSDKASDFCSVNVVVGTTILGDCDADGEVTAADATEILIFSANAALNEDLLLDEVLLGVFDYNSDGVVNALDACELLVWCARQGSGAAE